MNLRGTMLVLGIVVILYLGSQVSKQEHPVQPAPEVSITQSTTPPPPAPTSETEEPPPSTYTPGVNEGFEHKGDSSRRGWRYTKKAWRWLR